MRYLVLLCLSYLVFSCNDTETTVSMDDLKNITTSKSYGSDTVAQEVQNNVPDGFALTKVVDTLVGKGKWQKWDTLFYPQRFGPTGLQSWLFSNEKDSLSLVELQFSDSLKTFNAFLNWMDCYGPNCKSIRLYEPFKMQGRNTLILIKPKTILYLESNKLIPMQKVLQAIDKKKENQVWNMLITCGKGKKATWYRVEEGKLNELH